MSLPFFLGVGSLEIEERRPRSANEPRVKRLSFAKNRRHVTDDRYQARRGFSGDWAIVPHDVGQRRQNQIDEFDRKKAAAQLRFDEQEYRRQHQLNILQLQHDEERQRRLTIDAQRLNEIVLQGQRIPPHYWQQMQQEMQRQDMQRRAMHMQGHGEHRQLQPPPPPDHGHHEGGGGHDGADPRIVTIGPGGGHGGGHGHGRHGGGHDEFDEDGSDESEHGGHHGDRVRGRGRSRSSRRGRHENFAHGGGRGGHHGHGEQEHDIERVDSDSENGRSPRRIGGGHGQRLPREFRPRPRSRSRAHRSHSRPRNYSRSHSRPRSHSRMGARRTPLRYRRNYYSDDSDTEPEYGHYRIIRPRSRGSLRRRRSQSRHDGDYSSDDSFEHYNPKPRRRGPSRY